MKKYLNDEIENQIIDALPHGSGINYQWEITQGTRGRVFAVNAWDYIDTNGYEVGSLPFRVTFYKGRPNDCRVSFIEGCASRHHYWIDAAGLREYLPELFAEVAPQVAKILEVC